MQYLFSSLLDFMGRRDIYISCRSFFDREIYHPHF
nr:MAG TPA: hypothetical protein [Caudoviricetes sp.]